MLDPCIVTYSLRRFLPLRPGTWWCQGPPAAGSTSLLAPHGGPRIWLVASRAQRVGKEHRNYSSGARGWMAPPATLVSERRAVIRRIPAARSTAASVPVAVRTDFRVHSGLRDSFRCSFVCPSGAASVCILAAVSWLPILCTFRRPCNVVRSTNVRLAQRILAMIYIFPLAFRDWHGKPSARALR